MFSFQFSALNTAVGLTLSGHEELAANLKLLPERTQGMVVRPALAAAVKTLADYQRRLAPVGPTGNLRGAIGWRVMRAMGTQVAKAGINVGKQPGTVVGGGRLQKAPHAHLVGLGTRMRTRQKIGGKFRWLEPNSFQTHEPRSRSTGVMPRNNFIQRALTAGHGPALYTMRQIIARGVAREWGKLQKKMGSRY